MNGVHKLIKYKFEGPPSKVRVQTPSQKAFVLLQSAIGQHYLEDYTLRQEMSLAVEYASRMLSAAEDYSIEESKHGQVALECLLMRRCLATSLWSPADGVLNQVGGVGQKTAAKLAMNNIRSFEDLLSKSSNEIEQACGRASPFGQELRAAASKILQRRLSLSAHIEGMDSETEGNVLVCHVDLEDHIDEHANGAASQDGSKSIVKYTLAVHTDRPGDSLMFRADIVDPGCHRISCPAKFGRIYIRLVSNIVGLDESLMLDGNDTVAKGSFILTPVKAKESKKTAQKAKIGSKNDDTSPSILQHMNMVVGIDDLRVPKRKKPQKDESKVNVRTPSTSKKRSFFGSEKKVCEHSRTIVTPSPSLPEGPARKTEKSPVQSSRNVSTQQRSQLPRQPGKFDNNSAVSREPKRMRTHQGTWQKQKKEQNAFQQRAFGSPKENPFAAFKFDPNDCEKNLEQESKNNNQAEVAFHTIIPPSVRTPQNQTGMNHAQRRSRFLSSGPPNNRTPIKSKATTFIGSARRNKSAIAHLRIPTQDLLRQKAEEQQAYAMAMEHSRPLPQEHGPFRSSNHGTELSSVGLHDDIASFFAQGTTMNNHIDYSQHHGERDYHHHMGTDMGVTHGAAWNNESAPFFDTNNYVAPHRHPADNYVSPHHHPANTYGSHSFVDTNQPFVDYPRELNNFESSDNLHFSPYQANGSFEDTQPMHMQHHTQPMYMQHHTQPTDMQHQWESSAAQNSFGASFVQQSAPTFNDNDADLRPHHVQTFYEHQYPPQHGQAQEEYAPNRNEFQRFMPSNDGIMRGTNLSQPKLDPQGMIITVAGNGGADANNDADFENAFF